MKPCCRFDHNKDGNCHIHRETVAHKGYLIRSSWVYGTVWIEKDGVNICHAKSVEEAKAIIDRDLT